jgi:ssDNA-binding replication factor A large subunit
VLSEAAHLLSSIVSTVKEINSVRDNVDDDLGKGEVAVGGQAREGLSCSGDVLAIAAIGIKESKYTTCERIAAAVAENIRQLYWNTSCVNSCRMPE